MHVFKDRQGDSWTIDITIGTRERLKAAAGIDLYSSTGLKELLDVTDDPSRFVDILMILCEKELTGKSINREAFIERFDGDALESANDAFFEEVKLFIRPGMRPGLERMLGKVKELQKRLSDRQVAFAESSKMDEAVDRIMDKAEAMMNSELKSKTEEFGSEPPS